MASRDFATLGEWALVAFQENPDPVALTRLSDRVMVAVNAAFLRRMGLPEEKVIGKSTEELRMWKDLEVRDGILERLRRDGVVRDLVIEGNPPDGSRLVISFTARMVDIGGEPHILSISRDITARTVAEERLQVEQERLVRSERALRESEARFRALIEKSSDMVFLFDADWHVQFMSPSVSEWLGWSPEQVLERNLWETDLVDPDDRPTASEARRNLLAAPEAARRAVLRVRHRDGSWRLLDCLGRNLLDHPAVRGIVVNARDVTEQRGLEEQVRQAQKLESIGRLAGGVAHDFNNILTAVLSCAEALRGGAVGSDPEARGDVEQILAAGWRARDLTQQLLAFARKQVITPVQLDLNEVVLQSENLYRRVLGEDVALELELASGLWPVLCDRGLIEQVLMNLVVNARDAMPTGGTLVLRTGNVEGSPSAAGERQDLVRLAVQDWGCGMPAEVRAHLFEPFFTTKPPGKGTGLGLATVYGIVSQSNGSIHVDSEPDRGTTVTLTFPRSHAARPTQAAARVAPSGRRRDGETVLVVEDDPQVLAVTRRALAQAGYRVLVAGNGGEAIEVVRQEAGPLDLVVTDVVMPGLSGRAVVDALRVGQPGLRALYLSGYSGDAIANRGVLEAGINFLPKPFTAASLVERVQAILGGR